MGEEDLPVPVVLRHRAGLAWLIYATMFIHAADQQRLCSNTLHSPFVKGSPEGLVRRDSLEF